MMVSRAKADENCWRSSGVGFAQYAPICTILNTYVEEEMLDEKGKPDYTKLKPVLFEMPTYKYLRTGDIIGDCVKMSKAYGETLTKE